MPAKTALMVNTRAGPYLSINAPAKGAQIAGTILLTVKGSEAIVRERPRSLPMGRRKMLTPK